MSTGLARASVRSRPSAFAGTFAVLVFSGTVVTASTAVLRSAPGGEVGLMAAIFTLVTVYMSIFVIGQVTALAVAQRLPETALLRAIGAGPWQIRRMVAAEVLLTAVAALPVGFGAGIGLGEWWLGEMAARGMLSDGGGGGNGHALVVDWVPVAASAGVLIVTGVVGGLLAANRAARSRPAAVLGEAAVPRSGVTVLRVGLAVLALAGGIALTVASAAGSEADAVERIPLVLLAYLVAVGLAGPMIGWVVAAVAAGPLRMLGVVGELALAGTRARSRRMSAAITPVALVVAFGLTKAAALVGHGTPAWIDVFGTGLYVCFAGLVAVNTVVMLTLERLREVSLLRAIGAEGGQVRGSVLVEAGLTAVAGWGAGVAVAVAVGGASAGVSVGALPGWAWAGTGVGVAAIVLVPTAVALARLMRGRPLDGLVRRS